MFGSWLNGVTKHLRSIVLLGAAVTCWSIWLNKNDFVFEKKKLNSPLQVIYAISRRLLSWAILQRPEFQDTVMAASRHLEQMAKDIFTQAYGWRSSLRIQCHQSMLSLVSLAVCLSFRQRLEVFAPKPCISWMYYSQDAIKSFISKKKISYMR